MFGEAHQQRCLIFSTIFFPLTVLSSLPSQTTTSIHQFLLQLPHLYTDWTNVSFKLKTHIQIVSLMCLLYKWLTGIPCEDLSASLGWAYLKLIQPLAVCAVPAPCCTYIFLPLKRNDAMDIWTSIINSLSPYLSYSLKEFWKVLQDRILFYTGGTSQTDVENECFVTIQKQGHLQYSGRATSWRKKMLLLLVLNCM